VPSRVTDAISTDTTSTYSIDTMLARRPGRALRTDEDEPAEAVSTARTAPSGSSVPTGRVATLRLARQW
jgi:hypothetical protein